MRYTSSAAVAPARPPGRVDSWSWMARRVVSMPRCTWRSSARYGSAAPPVHARSAVARLGHREVFAKRVDVPGVERQRDPARAEAGAARDLRRDRRIAVAIAADPGTEADRRGVERQAAARSPRASSGPASAGTAGPRPRACARTRRSAERTSSSGDGRSRRTSSVSQAAVISRRSSPTSASRSSGVRSGRSRPASACAIALYFRCSVRRMISVGCAVMTSSMRSARIAACSRSGTGLGGQPRQRVFDRVGLRTGVRIALVRPAAADAMVLLGDVRQVQELREGARDRQRRVHRHGRQLLGQLVEHVGRCRAGAGPRALRAARGPARRAGRAPPLPGGRAFRRAACRAAARRRGAAAASQRRGIGSLATCRSGVLYSREPHEHRPSAVRHRRRRRASHRLAADDGHLRHGDRARRRLRSAALRDRPHQHRLLPPDAEGVGAQRAGARRAARNADPARLPSGGGTGRARPRRRPRRLRARTTSTRRPTSAPRCASTDAGSQSTGSGWTRPSSWRATAPRAGSCATSGPATASSAGSPASA